MVRLYRNKHISYNVDYRYKGELYLKIHCF